MKIIIASDHAGIKLKEAIKKYLVKNKISIDDIGTYTEDSVDYPDYAHKAARAIEKKKYQLGILVCGTGLGMSMAANKHKGIRAARLTSIYDAQMAKEHNNANILCFGARTSSEKLVLKMLAAFLKADFAGGRHTKRIRKISLA